MGSHLETVDVKTQVLGLRAGVTLETVTYDPRYMFWEVGSTL